MKHLEKPNNLDVIEEVMQSCDAETKRKPGKSRGKKGATKGGTGLGSRFSPRISVIFWDVPSGQQLVPLKVNQK